MGKYLAELYFRMADDAADQGNDRMADHYWQMGVKCEYRLTFPSADHWRG